MMSWRLFVSQAQTRWAPNSIHHRSLAIGGKVVWPPRLAAQSRPLLTPQVHSTQSRRRKIVTCSQAEVDEDVRDVTRRRDTSGERRRQRLADQQTRRGWSPEPTVPVSPTRQQPQAGTVQVPTQPEIGIGDGSESRVGVCRRITWVAGVERHAVCHGTGRD